MGSDTLYQRWIAREERKGAERHAPKKPKHPFEWGLEHLGISKATPDPYGAIVDYTRRNIVRSEEYFRPPEMPDSEFRLTEDRLEFPSAVQCGDEHNDLVRARRFPTSDRENVIVIVPHWNSHAVRVDRMATWLARLGFSSVVLRLPFHEERGAGTPDAAGVPSGSFRMVSANIGLTIATMRQAVQDVLAVVGWLDRQGYRRIGVLGASIGSCAGFLAAAHDARIAGFFANFMSSNFGEVVWTGLSTRHIRESLEGNVTLEQMRQVWLLNSPVAFVGKVRRFNPSLRQFIVSAKYDETFLPALTAEIREAYRKESVDAEWRTLSCGHYSLGHYWFRYQDIYCVIGFFDNLFRTGYSKEVDNGGLVG